MMVMYQFYNYNYNLENDFTKQNKISNNLVFIIKQCQITQSVSSFSA